MRFAVPQFIDVEDKLFGPLTLKQFIYLAGGLGVAIVLYFLLGIFVAILIGGPFVALACALAFFKVNNRSFVVTLESAFYFTLRHKLYLWKKSLHKVAPEAADTTATVAAKPFVPHLSESKLKELAWSLDIKESMYSPEQHMERKGTNQS